MIDRPIIERAVDRGKEPEMTEEEHLLAAGWKRSIYKNSYIYDDPQKPGNQWSLSGAVLVQASRDRKQREAEAGLNEGSEGVNANGE